MSRGPVGALPIDLDEPISSGSATSQPAATASYDCALPSTDRCIAGTLQLREAAAILDAAMRNKGYRATPLGQDIARFLRYMRSAKDASPRTLEDYESTLRRFATEHAHLEVSTSAPRKAPSVCSTSSRVTGTRQRRERGARCSRLCPRSSTGRVASNVSRPTRSAVWIAPESAALRDTRTRPRGSGA